MKNALSFDAPLIAACMLLAAAPGEAAEAASASSARRIDAAQVQTLTEDMTPEEYRRTYRRNRRLIRDAATDYACDSLQSLGAPSAAVKLMGVAARLAVEQEARLGLGSSPMGIEVKDFAAGDRSVLLGVRLRW